MATVTFDPSVLNHNPKVIKGHFKNVGDSIRVNEDIEVFIPERYLSKKLAYIGSTVKTLQVYLIKDSNNNYGVTIAPTMLDLTPDNIKNVIVDGTVNKVLVFNKGDVFAINRNAIQDETFMYNLVEEFFLQGKVPWFLHYDHLSSLFLSAKKYAGSNIGKSMLTMELMAGIIARDPNDKSTYLRQTIESKKDADNVAFVGLNNVYDSFDNTASKLIGGYYGVGVSVASVKPEKETSVVSTMLRS